MKCHRLNLTPLEPGSLLIWTYRDVAAEHHKGAAYQHRCYLVCMFHRGGRTQLFKHTHIHTNNIGYRSRTSPLGGTQHNQPCHQTSAEYIQWLVRKSLDAGSIYMPYLLHKLFDAHLYRINTILSGFLGATFVIDSGELMVNLGRSITVTAVNLSRAGVWMREWMCFGFFNSTANIYITARCHFSVKDCFIQTQSDKNVEKLV